ncbi:MAG: SAF domain-containing protein [Gaiellaceae bacterium]
MSGRFRAMVVAIGLAAIVYGVYRNHQHHPVNSIGAGVTVLVAKEPIKKGTKGSAIVGKPARIWPKMVRMDQVRSGALTDTQELVGKVALTNVARGAQLTSADFGPSTG